MTPQTFDFNDIEELRASHPEMEVIDVIDQYIAELFDIVYPAKKDSKTQEEVDAFVVDVTSGKKNEWGTWIYYPWLNKCVHLPPKKELRQLRTSRNRNLINSEEQDKLYATTIFIAGMSVGSNVVEALVSQGIGGKLLLADMDVIDPSNLNRIRAPLHHVGLHKVEAISRKIWEMDPYLEIIQLHQGVSTEVIETTFGMHTVDIVIDEMDALDMKILLREKAKSLRLPVIMAADDGDDALLDIERYDLDQEMQLFNGSVPADILSKIKAGGIDRRELGQLIGRYFVGPDYIPLRMYESLMEVGKSLPSWPQLGGAAALSGVSVAYAAKKIILGQPLKVGRTLISLDQKLSKSSDEELSKIKEYKKIMFGQDNE